MSLGADHLREDGKSAAGKKWEISCWEDPWRDFPGSQIPVEIVWICEGGDRYCGPGSFLCLWSFQPLRVVWKAVRGLPCPSSTLYSQCSVFSTGLGESSQEECENRSGFCCWVGMESLLRSPFVILRRKAKEVEKVCTPEAAGGGLGKNFLPG